MLLATLGLAALGPAARPGRSDGGSFRIRARENFESGTVDLADGRGPLRVNGLVSAFTLGYERPFDKLVGLAVQRGSLRDRETDQKISETTLGLEIKSFPCEKARLWFVRGGLLASAIDPDGGPGSRWNFGFSVGTGYEFPVWKVGLAPEAGGKLLWGSDSKSASLIYVALGVHFYVFRGDPEL